MASIVYRDPSVCDSVVTNSKMDITLFNKDLAAGRQVISCLVSKRI